MRFPLDKREISGYRFGVKTSYSNFHLGVDYRASTGTPLYAPENGEIIRQYMGQGGNTIVFRGRSGYTYRFMHLQDFVTWGEVREGQIIAHCDNTGLSTSAHLHLDITKPGLLVDPMKPSNFVDPETYDWDSATIPPMDYKALYEQEKADHAESIKEKELNYQRWQTALDEKNKLRKDLADQLSLVERIKILLGV